MKEGPSGSVTALYGSMWKILFTPRLLGLNEKLFH